MSRGDGGGAHSANATDKRNPVNQQLWLKLRSVGSAAKHSKVTFFDKNGAKERQFTIENNDRWTSVGDSIAPGVWTVTVETKGGMPRRRCLLLDGTPRRWRMALHPSQDVRGRVIDAKGRPIAGAQLTLEAETPPSGLQRWKASTNPAGSFVIKDVWKGQLHLRANARGYREQTRVIGGAAIDSAQDASSVGEVTRSASDAPADDANLVFQLKPAGAIAGRVTGLRRADGPVRIELQSAGNRGKVITDVEEGGVFQLRGLGEGPHLVRAVQGERASVVHRISELASGHTQRLVLRLRTARQVSGEVRTRSNQPLAGAKVCLQELTSGFPIGCEPLRDEAFRFAAASTQDLLARIEAPGFQSAREWLPEGQEPETIDIELLPLRSATGRVVDPKGQPLVGARVLVEGRRLPSNVVNAAPLQRVLSASPLHLAVTPGPVPPIPMANRIATTIGGAASGAHSVWSNSEGYFSFDTLPFNAAVFAAELSGFAIRDPREPPLVDLSNRHQASHVEIVMEPAGSLRGRVLSESGLPLAGAWVALNCLSRACSSMTVSDERGVFAFDGIVGRVELSAELSTDEGSVAAHERLALSGGSDAWIELRIPIAVARLSGRVVDGAGNGVAAAQVSLTSLSEADEKAVVRTGADGDFEFVAPHGKYTLRAAKAGTLSSPRTLSLASDQTLALELAPATALRLHLRDAWTGKELKGGHLRVWNADLDKKLCDEQLDGRSQASDCRLGVGSYRLVLSHSTYVTRHRSVEISISAVQDKILELDTFEFEPGASITGVVLSAAGTPAQDVPITVQCQSDAPWAPSVATASGEPDEAIGARSDSKGRYRIDALPRGSCNVIARAGTPAEVSVEGIFARSQETVEAPPLRLDE